MQKTVRQGVENPQHFSNTRLGTFRRCPQRYKYQYLEKQIEKGTGMSLRLGHAGHEALAVYYGTKDKKRALKVAEEDFFSEGADSESYENWLLLEVVLDRYLDWTARWDRWKIKAIEEELNVTHNGRLYMGRIDLLVEYKEKLYIVDHKFTKRPTERNLALDGQVNFYHMLARKSGLPIQGLIYNMVHMQKGGKAEKRPCIRQVEYRPETLDSQVLLEAERVATQIELMHHGAFPPYRVPLESCHWDCSYNNQCVDDLRKGM